jgi:hypothetical protein
VLAAIWPSSGAVYSYQTVRIFPKQSGSLALEVASLVSISSL